MAFCTLSSELNEQGFTVVDNIFITQFMSGAPTHCIEVYLFGLALCKEHDSTNSIDVMCRALDLTREDVIDAYSYWEELGIVNVVAGAETTINYLPIRADRSILRKIKSNKYADFTKQIQSIISGRMITTNEYNEYFMFLETTLFDPDALIFVAKYCVQMKKDANLNYRYILTVARNLATGGVKSLDAVMEKLQEHYSYSDDLALIFKNLHIKRSVEYADKEKYERWNKHYGFGLDTMLAVAKTVKSGGMDRLDALLEEYYSMNLLSSKEIADYSDKKQTLLNLAKDINKTIGVYYQSLDIVVQEYVAPWTQKGFDGETLLLIARYCFKSSVRTLAGMNGIVEKFFKLGLSTTDSINQYLEQILATDKQIRGILDNAGIVRNVIAQDRVNYRLWTENWNMPLDVILHVATLSANATNPITYLNKVLADYHNKGLDSMEKISQVSKVVASKTEKTTATKRNYPQREYSDSDLKALFANLDEIEV